jgi:hypothetical protein
MLTDIAGSLLELTAEQQIVHASSMELTLPIDVKLRRWQNALVFCADVPGWRWQTDWDPPFGQLRITLKEVRREAEQ